MLLLMEQSILALIIDLLQGISYFIYKIIVYLYDQKMHMVISTLYMI